MRTGVAQALQQRCCKFFVSNPTTFQEAQMRKLAPAFILTTIVALASGSALALGDMNKHKKAEKQTTSQGTTGASTSGTSSYNGPTLNPGGNVSGPASPSQTGVDRGT